MSRWRAYFSGDLNVTVWAVRTRPSGSSQPLNMWTHKRRSSTGLHGSGAAVALRPGSRPARVASRSGTALSSSTRRFGGAKKHLNARRQKRRHNPGGSAGRSLLGPGFAARQEGLSAGMTELPAEIQLNADPSAAGG